MVNMEKKGVIVINNPIFRTKSKLLTGHVTSMYIMIEYTAAY